MRRQHSAEKSENSMTNVKNQLQKSQGAKEGSDYYIRKLHDLVSGMEENIYHSEKEALESEK